MWQVEPVRRHRQQQEFGGTCRQRSGPSGTTEFGLYSTAVGQNFVGLSHRACGDSQPLDVPRHVVIFSVLTV